MKRILITNDNLKTGGIQTSLISLLRHLVLDKYEIDLVLFDREGDFIDSIPDGVNVIYVDRPLSTRKLYLYSLYRKKELMKVVSNITSSKRYDIGIAYNGYRNDCDLFVLKSNCRKRFLWVHNDLYNKHKNNNKFKLLFKSMKFKYSLFDNLVFVSNGAKVMFDRVLKVNTRRIVINNFFDNSRVLELMNKDTDIKLDDGLKIVTVGRLHPAKGYDRLLTTYANARTNNDKLYIIGDGQERSSLVKHANSLELGDRVKFLGNQVNPFNIMKQADVFILSSYYEGHATVVLEALACGLPVILPDIPGTIDVYDFFSSKYEGMIYRYDNNKKALYDILKELTSGKLVLNKTKVDFSEYNEVINDSLVEMLK